MKPLVPKDIARIISGAAQCYSAKSNKMSLIKACRKVAYDIGCSNPEASKFAEFFLKGNWNGALDWADAVLEINEYDKTEQK